MIKQIYVGGFPLALDSSRHIVGVDGLSAAEIDLSTFNRGGRHGVVLGNPRYRKLVFTIRLKIISDEGPAGLLREKDRIITAFRLQSSRTKLVQFRLEDGTMRSCEAITKRFIGGNLDPKTSFAMTPIAFQMIADKWYLEGDEYTPDLVQQNFGGMEVPMAVPMDMSVGGAASGNQVFNHGNTESLPRFRITGPLLNCNIINQSNGQMMSINVELGEGETLDLDCFDHTAIKNQVSNVRGDISGDWIELVPGANNLVFGASSQGDYRAQIIYRDAFIGI
jgi:phage-related protein